MTPIIHSATLRHVVRDNFLLSECLIKSAGSHVFLKSKAFCWKGTCLLNWKEVKISFCATAIPGHLRFLMRGIADASTLHIKKWRYPGGEVAFCEKLNSDVSPWLRHACSISYSGSLIAPLWLYNVGTSEFERKNGPGYEVDLFRLLQWWL